MAVRVVKFIRKNLYGDIVSLFNPEESWSPRLKEDVIRDIETGEHSYFIQWGSMVMDFVVAEGNNGKILKTDYSQDFNL
ncbi:MAG: DUF3892 domain-containing protein [Ignavibacteriae bacterium]|nr:DUF3892 domain-containing protein [Ignavibacteriota bacterium]